MAIKQEATRPFEMFMEIRTFLQNNAICHFWCVPGEGGNINLPP